MSVFDVEKIWLVVGYEFYVFGYVGVVVGVVVGVDGCEDHGCVWWVGCFGDVYVCY